MKSNDKRIKKSLNGVQILSIGFLVLIVAGAIILSLPISSKEGVYTNFLDSLFTSTSAVCVTGLVAVDTGTYWSTFGQFVIILLIQIGGLGFMSITVFVAALLGKKITLKDRLYVQESLNTLSIHGIVKMVKYVISFVFIVEGIGALLLSTQFIPEFGLVKGMGYSFFHSISTFCNAGFDLMGNYSSVTSYSSNAVVLITLSLLIIISGLGFTVILELLNYKNNKKLSIHSKIVLTMTLALIIFPTIFIFLLEYKNAGTMANMSFGDKILNSFFTAVSPRTAGFNSIDLAKMEIASIFLTIFLMFIGGSPGSTAGGLKTTTFAIAILTLISVIKGYEDTEAFGRRFSKELVYKAFALLMLGVTLVVTVTMILSITEYDIPFIDLFFEAASAFGTVGLTLGITQKLSVIGKIVIMITMYLGRVGPLTVMLALMHRQKQRGFSYPEGKVLIG
ncbi:trk system potassium uptake protein TrkH [Clostridium sp. DSM 8431]|uniref:TrkH family potassium uptake protein n=1 Tax=Clostridium sp. DSM 8431 TaxID=1761781 RepID=UPI0008F0CFA0|nr:TrkH family potassium uptake protein [Clostridium sp. DSM 8431]SFU28160.1 trk system potassium uptake protein TrkH [Clostridium sp. DSM 8431]